MKTKGQSKAPGVIQKASRMYITQADVSLILGCKQSKAYSIVKDVNKTAAERGKAPFPAGRANKYIFSDMYDIPIEEINSVLT